jgi:ribosome maturation protein SDO1
VSQIKHALGKNFTVNTHKPLKKQCLDAVKFLKNEIPIERAKMEVSLKFDTAKTADVMASLEGKTKRVVQEKTKLDDKDGANVLVLQVDPSLYRELDDICKNVGGQLEILQHVVSVEGDVDLDKEMARVQESKSRDAATAATAANALAEEMDELDLDHVAVGETKTESETKHVGDTVQYNEEAAEEDDVYTVDNDDSEEGGKVAVVPERLSSKNQKKLLKKAKKAQRRKAHNIETNEAPSHVDPASSISDTLTHTDVVSSTTATANTTTTMDTPNAKSCNTCGGAFVSTADYRAHFRSDWHRFNQKLKLQGQQPVSEEELRLCDAETFFGSFDT